MFDFDKFKENMSIFYYMFDYNKEFVEAKRNYLENEYVKTFSDSIFDEALSEIKMNMGFDKSCNEFYLNVTALDYNINIEYRINPQCLSFIRKVKLLEGEFANSETFSKCYEAYKSLDKMVTIFIESNFTKDIEVISSCVNKIIKHLHSENIDFKDVSYMDKKDTLIIKSDTVTIAINDFSQLFKGSHLSYSIVSDNPIGNVELEFINKSVRCVKKMFTL